MAAAAVAALLVVGALLATFLFRFTGFMGPDSGARFAMIRSWKGGGSLLFLDPARHDGDHRLTDALAGYVVHSPRGTCTDYPPLFPLLAGVAYSAFGPPGLVIWAMIGGALTVLFAHLAAGVWGLRRRAWVPVCIVGATPLVLYSSNLWDHSIHMALVAAAIWLLSRAYADSAGAARFALTAGACLGAGVFFHELFLLMGTCLIAAVVANRRVRTGLYVAIGFLLPVLAWSTFNRVVYGSFRGPHLMIAPLDLSYASFRAGLIDWKFLTMRVVSQISGGAGVVDWMLVGLAFVVPSIGAAGAPRLALLIALLASALALFLLLDAQWARGLLQATPWFLVALADPRGLLSPKQDGRAAIHRTLACAALAFLLGVVATPVAPGLNWGSRYMLTVLPVLSLLAVATLENGWTAVTGGWRLAGTVLAGLSFFVGALSIARGIRAYSSKMALDRTFLERASSIATPATATDLWWLAPDLEPVPLHTRLEIVRYVPGSDQFGSPLPADPDAAIRTAFFEGLDKSKFRTFSYLGTAAGLGAVRAQAEGRSRAYRIMNQQGWADWVLATFALDADSSSATAR